MTDYRCDVHMIELVKDESCPECIAELRSSDTVDSIVRPCYEPTSRGYDVSGPDSDGDMCIEFDVETNIIWLTRRDVEMLLARWPNAQVDAPSGATAKRR